MDQLNIIAGSYQEEIARLNMIKAEQRLKISSMQKTIDELNKEHVRLQKEVAELKVKKKK